MPTWVAGYVIVQSNQNHGAEAAEECLETL